MLRRQYNGVQGSYSLTRSSTCQNQERQALHGSSYIHDKVSIVLRCEGVRTALAHVQWKLARSYQLLYVWCPCIRRRGVYPGREVW